MSCLSVVNEAGTLLIKVSDPLPHIRHATTALGCVSAAMHCSPHSIIRFLVVCSKQPRESEGIKLRNNSVFLTDLFSCSKRKKRLIFPYFCASDTFFNSLPIHRITYRTNVPKHALLTKKSFSSELNRIG